MNMKVGGNRAAPTPAPANTEAPAENASSTPGGGVPEDLAAAIAPGKGRADWLSKKEAEGLIKNAADAGEAQTAALKSALAEGLQSGQIGGQELKLGEAALRLVADFAGVDAAVYRNLQNRDAATNQDLGAGLVKSKQAGNVAEAAQTQLAARAGKGELDPYAMVGDFVGAKLTELYDAKMQDLAEKDGGLHAGAEALHGEIAKVVKMTTDQLKADPEAMAKVTGVLSQVGEAGFFDALESAGGEIGKAFAMSTGVDLISMDTLIDTVSKLPEMIGDLSRNVADKIAGKMPAKAVDGAAEAAIKVADKLQKGAGAATKAANALGAGKVVNKVAADAVAEGGKAAASTGLRGVFKFIRVGAAAMAATRLFNELFADPRDGERIAKEGINTLLQTVGIAYPLIGLGADLVDVAWGAKIRFDEKEEGIEVTRADTAPMVSGPSRLLASALEGAGHASAADSFRQFADAVDFADTTEGVGRLETEAFSELSRAASVEVGRAAEGESDVATKAALHDVSHGFGEAFKVLYQQKKLKEENPEKASEMRGDLMRVVGDIATASSTIAANTGMSVNEVLRSAGIDIKAEASEGAEVVIEEEE